MNRYQKPDFYVMDIEEDNEDLHLPIMKVIDIQKLNESFIQVIIMQLNKHQSIQQLKCERHNFALL